MEEISSEVEQIARAAAAALGRVIELAARRRAEIERAGRDATLAAQRATEEQFTAWVKQRQQAYQKVGWHDWEDTATPAQWADAYATARAMREVDPAAVTAANRIEEQYQARFGVNIREAHDLWRESCQQHYVEGITLQAGGPDLAPEKLIEEHRPHYTVISDPGWQQQAQPQDWANAYVHARAAYDADPVARMAATAIEEQMQQRYEVDIRVAVDDELARRHAGLADEAHDLAAQSRAEQERAQQEREHAAGADPAQAAQQQHHQQQADLAEGRAENLTVASEDARQQAGDGSEVTTNATSSRINGDGTVVIKGVVLEGDQKQARDIYHTSGKGFVPMKQAMQQGQRHGNPGPSRPRPGRRNRNQKDLGR